MHRVLVVSCALLVFLVAATPVAAAPPIKTSGTFEQASGFSTTCEAQGANTICTDVFVDAFSFESEFSDVCTGMFTYSVGRNGQFRPISDAFGCAPATSFDMSADGTSASVAPTDVQLSSCNQRTCTDAGTVTVWANWSAVGTPTSYSGRATVVDGSCTYRQSFTGTQAQAVATISIDGTQYAGDGFLAREEFTVTERCR